ncbi:hypothetical protein [Anabaena azotica]|uniref:Uncharacterized protein n=1 Tax=Anabaena azotica FACHB-119 TaxID=947527 RepID=A0ABR8CYD1_9NOST|nr:hypothetical protein [Anabaena azotica]MBD2499832.1 hypothetical protein [Anabaena azotica FACHB-119]
MAFLLLYLIRMRSVVGYVGYGCDRFCNVMSYESDTWGKVIALLLLGLRKAIAKLEWLSIHLSMNIVMSKKTGLI